MKWYIHHVALNTLHVQETIRFLRDALGLEGYKSRDDHVGGNPTNADTDSCFFFSHTGQALHIGKPDLMFALKHQIPINPTYGGHLAINVPDLNEMRARLKAAGVLFADPGNWGAIPNIQQIYVCDPSMNIIEINQTVPD